MNTNTKGMKSLSIKEVKCNGCGNQMKVAWGTTSYASGGKLYYGVSSLEKEEITVAKKKGVIIKDAAEGKSCACFHCGALRNGFSIQECLYEEDEEIKVAIA